MPFLTAILLALSLALAVVFGPKLEAYLWGPALMSLAAASVSAVIHLWRGARFPDRKAIIVLGVMLAGWIAWRCSQSPVQEPAEADLLLMASAVASFLCLLSILGNRRAEQSLAIGIAGLLVAQVLVVGMQAIDPSFRVLYAYGTESKHAAGFFAHYNDGANFLVAASLITLGLASFSPWSRPLRWTLGIIAVLGMVAVWFTLSRGGFLSAIVGLAAYSTFLLVHGKQRKAKWFPIAAIGFPLIGMSLFILLIRGWESIEAARGGGTHMSSTMDNTVRLQLLDGAVSCLAEHPWLGGGSRSFGWEFFRHWDYLEMGFKGTAPDFVHNEWMQMATDYGLIGLLLLVTFVGTVIISGCIHSLFAGTEEHEHGSDAWRLAGMSACIALLAHGCFSFVFHIVPGTILLGMTFAMACASSKTAGPQASRWLRLTASLSLAAASIWMLPHAWRGCLISPILIPPLHSKDYAAVSLEEKISRLSKAIEIRPQASLYHERGLRRQAFAQALVDREHDTIPLLTLALDDYQMAHALHPYDGETLVNLANLSSQLQRTHEADAYYQQLIAGFGPSENTFRAHYFYAKHLYLIGMKQLIDQQYPEAAATMAQACKQIDEAARLTAGFVFGLEGYQFRISCHEMHGVALQFSGETDDAWAAYQVATNMYPGLGGRVHLRAAILKAQQANRYWFDRQPELALGLFIQARQLSQASAGQLPEGISEQDRNAFNETLNQTIGILQRANIQPKEN